MDVTALVFSVVALLVAGASAWYTREQSRHAKVVAGIETDRRAEEIEAQRTAALDHKRANIRLHVQRVENIGGSLDELGYTYSIVVTNDGPAEAGALEVAIGPAWNDQRGTRAHFVSGERRHRIGRLPPHHREVLQLRDDQSVDYSDIGDCEVRWRDEASANVHEAGLPARPNWV